MKIMKVGKVPPPTQRDNFSVNNLNTSSLNINEPTTSAIASNSNLNVSGEVNLKLDNMPTNSVMTKEEFARYLINNPDAIAAISSQLLNKDGTYGGSVTSMGIELIILIGVSLYKSILLVYTKLCYHLFI